MVVVAMKLEREVRHKSEDIENDVLLDVLGAVRRRVRAINRSYDIPYIAGYSTDGNVVFIDRHLPRTFRSGRMPGSDAQRHAVRSASAAGREMALLESWWIKLLNCTISE